jgi:glutamate synthase (NADPH/NADH) small chain
MSYIRIGTFCRVCGEFVDGGVMLADSKVYVDDMGIERVDPIFGSEKLFKADSMIIAISQGPRAVIVSSTEGINVNAKGLVQVDNDGNTTRKGVFASGDVVTGAKTVVEAVKISKHVAEAMHEYVQSLKA